MPDHDMNEVAINLATVTADLRNLIEWTKKQDQRITRIEQGKLVVCLNHAEAIREVQKSQMDTRRTVAIASAISAIITGVILGLRMIL